MFQSFCYFFSGVFAAIFIIRIIKYIQLSRLIKMVGIRTLLLGFLATESIKPSSEKEKSEFDNQLSKWKEEFILLFTILDPAKKFFSFENWNEAMTYLKKELKYLENDKN